MKETQNTESNQINHPLASRFLYLTPDSWGKENCSLYAGSPVPVPLKHIIPTSNELWIRTSKTPRQRPRLPLAPASSCTSLNAATRGSSVGSIPPPGTIHSPCLRLAVTSNTCHAPETNHYIGGSVVWWFGVVRRRTCDSVVLSSIPGLPTMGWLVLGPCSGGNTTSAYHSGQHGLLPSVRWKPSTS